MTKSDDLDLTSHLDATAASLKIAILIHRIGPYHRARLRALAKYAPVAAIETCAADRTYGWTRIEEEDCYSRATLFSNEAHAGNISILRRAVEDALDRISPDVVAVPGWADAAGLLALAWARKNDTPVVLMSDSQEKDAPRRAWTEMIKRAVVSFADAGFVAGRSHADYLVSLGMPRVRIVLGYDVVDNDHFSSLADTARSNPSVARQVGLAQPAFLSVSRFVLRKNLLTLIKAHARYCEEARKTGAQPWRLVLVGDGFERPSLVKAAHNEVDIRPFAQYNELPILYGLAGALVVPSLVDQWSLVVNEAMAAGCPVIVSSRAGAAGELVEDGITGHVTEPDELALTRALIRMANCTDRFRLAETARQRIANWSPERFATGILEAASLAHQRRGSYVPTAFLAFLAMQLNSVNREN